MRGTFPRANRRHTKCSNNYDVSARAHGAALGSPERGLVHARTDTFSATGKGLMRCEQHLGSYYNTFMRRMWWQWQSTPIPDCTQPPPSLVSLSMPRCSLLGFHEAKAVDHNWTTQLRLCPSLSKASRSLAHRSRHPHPRAFASVPVPAPPFPCVPHLYRAHFVHPITPCWDFLRPTITTYEIM